MNSKLKMICRGIEVKLDRGEELEDILASYVKLNEEEKDMIRVYFADIECKE